MRRFVFWVFVLLLAGCTPSATFAPTLTPMPTLTPTPVPTTTPVPPTPTSTPTVTSTPRSTPTLTPTPTATSTPTPTPTPFPPVTWGQEVALNQGARERIGQMTGLPGYTIQAKVDMDNLTVTGHQRVIYTNRYAVPLDEVYFNLYPNAPRFGKEMTVSNLTVNGQPLGPIYEKDRRALRVPFVSALQPGQRVMIEMDLHLQVLQMTTNDLRTLVYSKGMLSLGGWYPMLAVWDGGSWRLDYPEGLIGEAMFAESAFYAVDLTVPQSLVVAATGIQVAEVIHDDGTRTLSYRSGPVPTFYIAAAQDYQVINGQVDEIAVHSYYRTGHQACGQWSLEAASEAIKLYQELYGPYPFNEFDIVEADYGYQGFEWPGLVLIGGMSYEGTGPACGEWFVAHETAHQWWYNVVGNDPVTDPWLDEALTQYSTMLYFRRFWSASAAQAYIQAIIYDHFAPYAEQKKGIQVGQPTTAFKNTQDYFAITYARGAMFIEQVHTALGDQAFFTAMQQYYQENQFQIARPETLYAALQQANPEIVKKLWNEWVTGP